jgi:hypothetical protein
MSPRFRRLLVCIVAYVAGLAAAMSALIGLVDPQTFNLTGGLPTVAIMTPMIAVLVFWGVARAMKVPLDPVRTFLFGAIAIYSLLYLCGRLVGAGLSSQLATLLGAIALFGLAYFAVTSKQAHGR